MLRASRVDVASNLRIGGRTIAGGSRRAQSVLVVAQITIAGILLFSTALIGRTLLALGSVDPGFRTDGVLIATLHAPDRLIPDEAEVGVVMEQLRQRVLAEPTVREAGFTDFLPLSTGGDQNGFSFAGAPGATGDAEHDDVTVDHLSASAGYFRTVGIAVVAGRGFTSADASGSEHVVVIDEALARRFWPGGGAVGGTVRYFNEASEARIVGVIDHARRYDVREDGRAQIYSLLQQRVGRDLELAVLTDQDPMTLVGAVRQAAREVDPRVSIDQFRTLDESFDDALSPWRFMAEILVLFSTASVFLTALGTYGVVAVSVSRRAHEMGVRAALGARSADIGRTVLDHGLRLGLTGAALALGGSAVMGRFLAGFLFDVAPLDPVSLATAGGVLVAIVVLATAIPAHRAARISPTRSLRPET
jgi:predicted permease